MICRCHKFQFCVPPPSHLKWSFLVAPSACLQERGPPFIGLHSIWGLPSCTALWADYYDRESKRALLPSPSCGPTLPGASPPLSPSFSVLAQLPGNKGFHSLSWSLAPFPLSRRQETSGLSQDCAFKASTWAAFHHLGLKPTKPLPSPNPLSSHGPTPQGVQGQR